MSAVMVFGQPVAGSRGLADPLARMQQNFTAKPHVVRDATVSKKCSESVQ